jgi:DNA-binding MarR family transcriptional regulator
MVSRLQEEIRQTRPFSSLEDEALLNIVRTADRLQYHFQQALKPHGITPTQYNVLRILRGAGEAGLRCSDIGERLISSDPDITRLLGRLQKLRLVRRRRNAKDRRVIYARISPKGLELLEELDPVVKKHTQEMLKGFNHDRLLTLISLLEEVRGQLTQDGSAASRHG